MSHLGCQVVLRQCQPGVRSLEVVLEGACEVLITPTFPVGIHVCQRHVRMRAVCVGPALPAWEELTVTSVAKRRPPYDHERVIQSPSE